MKTCARIIAVVKENALLVLTLVGVALGIGLGFAVRETNPSDTALMWLGLPGQLYLRLLKMMIVPLIVTSVISGTASLEPRANGKISVVAFTFVFLTNLLGAVLGVLTFLAFKPGNTSGRILQQVASISHPIKTSDILADLLRNIIPDNLFEATFRQTQTSYVETTIVNLTGNMTNTQWVKEVGKSDGPNLLGLIFACTLLGIAAASVKGRGKPLIDFFEAATQTVIAIIRWFLWTTPIGVLSLILVAVAGLSDVAVIFSDLGIFIAAVTVALVVQQLVVMPLVLFGLTRRNPYAHMLGISRPWIIAFASASTAVAIPEMLYACEVKLSTDRRIARFVIPFSVTVSANGSAVFIACSCLFISNFSGNFPSIDIVFTTGVLSTVASLAIPSVPSASIVSIVMILTSLNIPAEAVALLLAVDFFLDRVRTTSSVVSHTMCAVVTYHMCKNSLTPLDDENDLADVELQVVPEEGKLLSQEVDANV
ncbi:excitatory amino acid transporter-like [Mya arenaria]|uniref:excitatory amino acid transporter-like n=1 Tax=Mya arenaria TaxID=6604 RepID=UPI0022E088B6|nr:excitatory amino acid transporter-like [Mya arenaria]